MKNYLYLTKMLEILYYPFFQNALISTFILGFILPVLGIFLVLKKITFVGDALGHASLLGVALGFLFNLNTTLTLILWIIFCALFLYFLEKKSALNYDLLIMILSIIGMAGGILFFSILPLAKASLTSFLFGNILLTTKEDIYILILILIVLIILWKLYWKDLTLTFINKDLAYTENIKVDFINFLFLLVLSFCIAIAIKIMGVLLVSTVLLIPVSISKFLSSSFKSLVFLCILFGEIISISGLFISYFLNLPPGPLIAFLGIIILIFVLTLKNFMVK